MTSHKLLVIKYNYFLKLSNNAFYCTTSYKYGKNKKIEYLKRAGKAINRKAFIKLLFIHEVIYEGILLLE